MRCSDQTYMYNNHLSIEWLAMYLGLGPKKNNYKTYFDNNSPLIVWQATQAQWLETNNCKTYLHSSIFPIEWLAIREPQIKICNSRTYCSNNSPLIVFVTIFE